LEKKSLLTQLSQLGARPAPISPAGSGRGQAKIRGGEGVWSQWVKRVFFAVGNRYEACEINRCHG